MALLSVAELKEHIETDLASDALQRLLDATEELIDNAAGGVNSQVQYFDFWNYPNGQTRVLHLNRKASSITSIIERDRPEDDPITLASDDYRLEGTRTLKRLREGANSRAFWATHVVVTYAPESFLFTRKRVQIDLVKLALQNTGDERQTYGDITLWHGALSEEDAKVRAALRPIVDVNRPLIL